MLIGKWQQSLKAWIQLLVAKPQTWAKLCRVGWVNRRKRWTVVVVNNLPLLRTLDLSGFREQTPGSYRRKILKLALRGRWVALRAASGQASPPCLQEEWYGPCCLGELTLLSGIGRISRAHCFQGLSAQSGRSCLLFFPSSGHVWILEDKEKIFHSEVLPLSLPSSFSVIILFHLLWLNHLVSWQVGLDQEAVNGFEITAGFLCLNDT